MNIYGMGRSRAYGIYSSLRRRTPYHSQNPRQWYTRIKEVEPRFYATALPVQRPSYTRNVLIASTITLGAGLGYLYFTDTRASVHRWLAVPLIRAIWPDAEDAHKNGVQILKVLYQLGLQPRERGRPDDERDLETKVFGHTLVNPLGISSGLDKHGEIPTQLLALGPAVVEIGGVTPNPQGGNPRPRVFRITSQQGMINRYGLNSHGAVVVAARLRQRVREFAYARGYGLDEDAERFVLDGDAGVPPGSLVKGKLLAVQVAKNESTPDEDIEAIRRDYVKATKLLARYADIIVVNVSCPNASGYRELQHIEPLKKILSGVVSAAMSVDRRSKPAVMVKVSPDEDSEEQVASICTAVFASGVDGVVVGNTTKSRPTSFPDGAGLSESEATIMRERGGYSGPQVLDHTLSLVKRYRQILDYLSKEQTGSQQLQLEPREGLGTASGTVSILSASHQLEQSSGSNLSETPASLTPKVIFCTGG